MLRFDMTFLKSSVFSLHRCPMACEISQVSSLLFKGVFRTKTSEKTRGFMSFSEGVEMQSLTIFAKNSILDG